MPILIDCICQNPRCAKPFVIEAFAWRGGQGKYCSPVCYRTLHQRIACVCQNPSCGRAFLEKPSVVAQGGGKFCSKACYKLFTAPEERFWRHIRICAHGRDCVFCCFPWTASVVGGYGMFEIYIEGKRRGILTHRFAWELFNNRPVPDGLDVLHWCDNPPCGNGMHLTIGDQQRNMSQAVERHRMCHGSTHPKARLSEQAIPLIWEMHRQGSSSRHIAQKFGVSHNSILQIIRHKTWKHIDIPTAASCEEDG